MTMKRPIAKTIQRETRRLILIFVLTFDYAFKKMLFRRVRGKTS